MIKRDKVSLGQPKTLMLSEALEAPGRVRDQLKNNQKSLKALAENLKKRAPKYVMICARGSSSHAGVYARYLIETRLHLPVMPTAPSISSVYNIKQDVSGAVFLAISQSGASPDIIAAAQTAKAGGAFVIALINTPGSPLAQCADYIVDIGAGKELSVAATKSFICTLSAIAQLIAFWAEAKSLQNHLDELPNSLDKAAHMDWSNAMGAFEHAQSSFVISRGLGLSAAKETALKFKETCSLHAESFSASEVKHGPMTLVKKDFPVLIYATHDQTQNSIDDVITAFTQRGANVFIAGSAAAGGTILPAVPAADPALTPLLNIQSFYPFVNSISLARGYNPDRPEYLNKVTQTL